MLTCGRGRALRLFTSIGLASGFVGFLVASGSARTVAAPAPVKQLEFPALLAAPGEPLEVGYDTRRVRAASGFLYVRNDTQRAFARVQLRRRIALQQLVPNDQLRVLRALVPGSLVGGHKLFYYAVLNVGAGRSLRIPARSVEKVLVLTGARVVSLGTHRFGHLRAPGEVVARAGPTTVGFVDPAQGPKRGPSSFDVAADRSVWVLDPLNKRLLVWPAGSPDATPRAVPLGSDTPIDFARGPAGTTYVTRRAPDSFTLQLFHLTPTGDVTWKTDLATEIDDRQLRVGADGTLFWTGGVPGLPRTERGGPANAWVPAASPAAQPFSTTQQRRALTRYQPLPGGGRLVWTIADFRPDPIFGLASHENRVALMDRMGRLVRAWRITSTRPIWPYPGATPTLVGGDPVVVVLVANHSQPPRSEYVVLRLAETPSGTRAKFSLPAASTLDTGGRSMWGDVITDLRIGPGAAIYQLGSSPATGVTIFRYPF